MGVLIENMTLMGNFGYWAKSLHQDCTHSVEFVICMR